MKLKDALETTNIVENLEDDVLHKIANQVVDGFDVDKASRKPWEDDLKNWTELALQIASDKTFPWQGAANIKYPLLATAAMQFAARAYPTLVPSNNKIVKCRVVGSDPTGQKTARAERISTHMSYQLLDQMEGWEEDMDKLLLTLPIAGTCFKKSYWDSAKQRNCSQLVLPKSLVVNYYARNLDDAERVTEVFEMSKRQVKERQNRKFYIDVDLGDPNIDTTNNMTTSVNQAFQNDLGNDESTPYQILEQHTYYDLDEDGYAEPYVITVEYGTRTVLRMVPRFGQNEIEVDEKGNVIAIKAIQYYTKYSFIPNPDGGFYDIGFGRLLGPLNNSANTIINQLVDAGSLSNLQSGFIGKGLRIKMGESRFQPGEWKPVNAVGTDIKAQIFPLPVREPSSVLFNLLDLLLKSGKELASVAEIFVGKMPGQNTPATTTMASIEQGMKVFTAVYKRVYRSLTSEFRKIYKLNREYMNPEEEVSVLDQPIQQSDYLGPEDDIIPGADPAAVSSQEKQAKAQALMQILQLGTINPMAVTQLYLEAHEIPEAEKYMMQPQPKPDPKQQELQMKAQLDQQKAQQQMQIASNKMKLEQVSKEQEMTFKERMQQVELQGKQVESVLKAREAQAKLVAQHQEHQQQMIQTHQQNQMNMSQQHANHQMQMQHQNEAAKLQQKQQTSKEMNKSGPTKR